MQSLKDWLFRKFIIRLVVLQLVLLLIVPGLSLLILHSSFRAFIANDVQRLQTAIAATTADNLSSSELAHVTVRANTCIYFYSRSGQQLQTTGTPLIGTAAANRYMQSVLASGGEQESSLWSQITGSLVFAVPLLNQSKQIIGVMVYCHYPQMVVEFCNVLTLALLLLALAGVVIFTIITRRVQKKLSATTRSLQELSVAYARNQYDAEFERSTISDFYWLEDSFIRMAQKIAAQIQQLNFNNEQQRNFTSNASHELQTPVTAIRLATETLMDFPDLPLQQRHSQLEQIRSDALRLENIVNDLLLLAKTESGAVEFSRNPLDCAEIIRRQLAAAFMQHGERRLQLSVPDELPICSSPVLCEIIINNLLDNACKYSSPSATIFIRAASSNGHLGFAVANSGTALEADDIPHLFERFYRGKKTVPSHLRGSGIGLALVRQAVLLLGGTIDAALDGDVITFSVTLPLK